MTDLGAQAVGVLRGNEAGGYIAPARGLYAHQHLWDTCFTAIGQCHYDPAGAMGSVRRLPGAQWRNGMVPHIIFQPGWKYWWDRRNWRSWVSPSAPPGLATGGITEPPVAALMPLYAGCLSQARASRLAGMLADPQLFGSPYPVPSVPLSSRWFSPVRYWQGPTWVNMNWLLIDGLRRHGFAAEAGRLRQRTLDLARRSGFWEYYHPITGDPAGMRDFSWTAALTIDLLAW